MNYITTIPINTMSAATISQPLTTSKSSKKSRRKRRKRDPTQPKRPQSAYFFFAQEMRSTLKEKFPTDSLMEISKRMGEAWHALSDDAKRPFQTKAAAAKEIYTRQMTEWRAKQPPKVKKPSTAYNFFMKDRRAEILAADPSLTQSQAMVEVGRAWKSADDSTKSKYVQLAAADKERYKREMETDRKSVV